MRTVCAVPSRPCDSVTRRSDARSLVHRPPRAGPLRCCRDRSRRPRWRAPEDPPVRASLWFRARAFYDGHANKIGLTIVVAAAAAGLAGVRWEAAERAESDKRAFAAIDAAAEEREDQICEGLRSGQRADR